MNDATAMQAVLTEYMSENEVPNRYGFTRAMAGRMYLRPYQHEWPDHWLVLSGLLLLGSTLGAICLWLMSREPEL